MAKRELPSPDLLRQLLDYNPDTGVMKWRIRPPELFKVPSLAKSWNRQYAGKETGRLNGEGYPQILIYDRPHRTHRIAWAISYGEWPSGDIDHINGMRTDNRLINLRVVTAEQNRRNMALHPCSKTGVPGVHKRARDGKPRWIAIISVKNRMRYLGTFLNVDDAIAARKAAEVELGYHSNHGKIRDVAAPKRNR